jgi:hypothetical protein
MLWLQMLRKNPTAIENTSPSEMVDTSDQALADHLKRLKASVDPEEIRQLTDRIEPIIFHKQFTNA